MFITDGSLSKLIILIRQGETWVATASIGNVTWNLCFFWQLCKTWVLWSCHVKSVFFSETWVLLAMSCEVWVFLAVSFDFFWKTWVLTSLTSNMWKTWTTSCPAKRLRNEKKDIKCRACIRLLPYNSAHKTYKNVKSPRYLEVIALYCNLTQN